MKRLKLNQEETPITNRDSNRLDFFSRNPEQLKDEMFIGNATEKTYKQIAWKTKRKGKQAYNHDGSKCPKELFPVFIKSKEVTESIEEKFSLERK